MTGENVIRLVTKRLVIRNFLLDDVPALQEIVIAKETGEYAVYDYEWPTSEEAIAGLAERYAGYDGFLAVCLKETGRLIGFLSFDPVQQEAEGDEPPDPTFELGYCLHPAFRGHGYITEACRAIAGYAFVILSASKICAGTAAVNTPSLGVLQRIGMRKVREETVAFRNDANGDPIAFTGYMFELTHDEWLENPGESPFAFPFAT